MKAIIFDIDGTLADITHRLHFIQGEKKDYKSFYAACVDDTPKYSITTLFNMLEYSKPTRYFHEDDDSSIPEIIFVSGRPEDYRDITTEWLHKHLETCDLFGDGDGREAQNLLFMRKSGDYRPDYIIKEEILRDLQAKGYEILFTVDDRQQVVDMWRRNGITCLQVEQWEETPKIKTPPGKLALMVGPSGAGKSTYIANWAATSLYPFKINDRGNVISSDKLRLQFCGDFKDQSKNDQVFYYLHKEVELRIKLGLDTVVDATNIRNKDRKSITTLVPENTEIYYIVIDRPLEKKIEHAGWRKNVMIGDQTLVEKHHQVFQSNLKDILAGDNDPRVTVIDQRIK